MRHFLVAICCEYKTYFQLKKLFKVIWKNENNPVEGFDGLYLTNEDVRELQHIVATHRRNGFHQIDGIIGKEVHFIYSFDLISLFHVSSCTSSCVMRWFFFGNSLQFFF